MSEIQKIVEDFLIKNWERFFWIAIGGWIQIYLSHKKGVKYSKLTILGSLLLSAFVGYWGGELMMHFGYVELSNFIASLSAIGSHSILNFYSENISVFIKAILKGKFKINIEDAKEDTKEDEIQE